MLRCDGLPTGPCPGKRNDSNVQLGEGDLMLCRSCDAERHHIFFELKKDNQEGKKSESVDDDGSKRTSVVSKKKCQANETSVKHASETKVSDPASNDESKLSVVINELLMYAVYHRNRLPAASLRSVILNSYSGVEIAAAKKQLLLSFGQYVCDTSLSTERCSSTQRSASDAEIDDILELLDIVDNLHALTSVQFVTAKYDRLPGYGPEQINVCSLLDRQVAADKNIADLVNKVDALSSSHVVHRESSSTTTSDLSSSMQSIEKQLTDLNRMIQNTHSVAKPTQTDAADRDRQCNMIVFGIAESSDRNVWRNKVLEVLRHAAGHEIMVSDAFRLGRYNSASCRPVLVKMQSIWDRRTVLSGSRKLADIPEFRRSVYIYPDEPVEVRRRKTFDRMKGRAMAEGKQVSVTEDVLRVNGVDVFSLCQGLIRGSSSGVTNSQNDQ